MQRKRSTETAEREREREKGGRIVAACNKKVDGHWRERERERERERDATRHHDLAK
jgi:hypothetical protein